MELIWQLPCAEADAALPADCLLAQWTQLASAAQAAGFAALHLPAAESPLLEPLTLAAMLGSSAGKLHFLVSLSAQAMLPAMLAGTLQSAQSLTGRRMRLHLDNAALPGTASLLNSDQRHAQWAEYLEILDRLLRPPQRQPVQFKGNYFRLENAGLPLRLAPELPLWLDVCNPPQWLARHADVVLLQADHPGRVGALVESVRQYAPPGQRRRLQFACRVGVIARDTEAQAWDEANRQQVRLMATHTLNAPLIGPEARRHGVIALPRQRLAVRRCEIYPNLWHAAREQTPTLVGSHTQVAQRLQQLHEAGIDQFILSAAPAATELQAFAENVLPRWRRLAAQAAPREQA